MNNFAQLCIVIALTLGVILVGHTEKHAYYKSIVFVIMRFVQPLFNYIETLVGRSSKMGNIICFIFFTLVTVIM